MKGVREPETGIYTLDIQTNSIKQKEWQNSLLLNVFVPTIPTNASQKKTYSFIIIMRIFVQLKPYG